MRISPPESKSSEQSTSLPSLSLRQLGMLVLYCSMSVLFLATVIGFWFTRLTSDHYRAPGLPDLPKGLVLSTLLIAATSLCIWQAQRGIAKNLLESVKRWLFAAARRNTSRTICLPPPASRCATRTSATRLTRSGACGISSRACPSSTPS